MERRELETVVRAAFALGWGVGVLTGVTVVKGIQMFREDFWRYEGSPLAGLAFAGAVMSVFLVLLAIIATALAALALRVNPLSQAPDSAQASHRHDGDPQDPQEHP